MPNCPGRALRCDRLRAHHATANNPSNAAIASTIGNTIKNGNLPSAQNEFERTANQTKAKTRPGRRSRVIIDMIGSAYQVRSQASHNVRSGLAEDTTRSLQTSQFQGL